jgi:RimJ/RimL family protein N-acetyltransferase
MTPVDGVLLKDGTAAYIRPVRADDKDRLDTLTDGLTFESRFRRYLAPKGRLTDAELAYLTEIDHRDHEALVALDRPAGEAIGVARYIRHRSDPHSAEAAIVVTDRWQRRGVGMALLRRLAAQAHAHGVRRFTGTVLSHNSASLRLLARLGPCDVTHEGGGTATVAVELSPRERGGRSYLLT